MMLLNYEAYEELADKLREAHAEIEELHKRNEELEERVWDLEHPEEVSVEDKKLVDSCLKLKTIN